MRIRSIQVLACLAVMILLTTTVLTQNDTRYKELPNLHRVNDWLFRGGQPKPDGFELLRQLGFKTVVNLRDEDRRARAEAAHAERVGLRYYNIPIGRWGRPDVEEIQQVLSIIDRAERPVFVHCKHGADRTGVVIAAYRITYDGWTGERALAEAERYGMKRWQLGKKLFIHDFYERRIVLKEIANQ